MHDSESSTAFQSVEARGRKVTAVIPAFNEESRIGRTIRQVAMYVDEVLVVDDGSVDDTARVAAEAGARVLRLPRNEGYVSAVKRGFAEASGDVVVTFDADGEFPADKIPDLVGPVIRQEADMVQGARETVPRWSERILSWIANCVAPVGDTGTGFRAMGAGLARSLEISGSCICGVLALEATLRGARLEEVPVRLQPTGKPRRMAWYHLWQLFAVLRMVRQVLRARGKGA